MSIDEPLKVREDKNCEWIFIKPTFKKGINRFFLEFFREIFSCYVVTYALVYNRTHKFTLF